MTSPNFYFVLKMIGQKSPQQVAVKNFDSSSSPNFDDKCFIELFPIEFFVPFILESRGAKSPDFDCIRSKKILFHHTTYVYIV